MPLISNKSFLILVLSNIFFSVSCSQGIKVKIQDENGRGIHRANIFPQPIVLHGSGNQANLEGIVVVYKMKEVEKYKASKSGFVSSYFSYSDIEQNPVVTLDRE